MKKVLLGLLCVAVCSAVFAAPTQFGEPERLNIKLDAIALYRQATAPRALVAYERGGNAFLFAVVGSAPGQGGTYFHSEVTLVNNDNTFDQNVAVLFFPSSGGTCNPQYQQAFRLKAGTFYHWNDFVNDVFGATGLGSLVVLGINSSGQFDSTANIDGFSRIWTPISGFQGTASQSFPSVAISGDPGTLYMYGLRQDSSFRTNLFIFNYNPNISGPRIFAVNVVGLSSSSSPSFTMTVQPCSLGIVSLNPYGNLGSTAVAITPPDSAAGWFAFGSSNDNLSGDNWSVAARPNTK